MGMLMRRHYVTKNEAPEETADGPSEDLDTQDPSGGAPEGSESTGSPAEGSSEGEETGLPVPPPTRNASKADWLAFLGLDADERSRDELADSVLGSKA